MWCSAADTHLKLVDRVVSCASFLTGDMFECYIAHRRSVAVLCMLYRIRCDPIHPLYGALPVPYVPVRFHAVLWLHIGILMGLLAAQPRSIEGHLFTCECQCGTILPTLYSMVWDWRVSRAWPIRFYWPFLVIFPFLFYLSIGWYCGAGLESCKK